MTFVVNRHYINKRRRTRGFYRFAVMHFSRVKLKHFYLTHTIFIILLTVLLENISLNVQRWFSVTSVCVESGESPSASWEGGHVCASPHSSSTTFVIIKFSESRFCLSDTLRGSCEKTIFAVNMSEEGKTAETNVFHQGKDWESGKPIQNNSICQRFPLSHLWWRTPGG